MKLMSVGCIWQQGAHNAFTSLVRFKGALYCVFREGHAHVSPDGALRVLQSRDDGQTWTSTALLQVDYADLRDGKFIEYQGELKLLGGGTLHATPTQASRLQSHLWSSIDGVNWSQPQFVAEAGYWLWSGTCFDNAIYGVGYRPGPTGDVRLYKSDNGISFYPWVTVLQDEGYVNESSLVFVDSPDDSALSVERAPSISYCLLRRDPVWGPEFLGLLGRAEWPFTQWQWLTLDKRIGGPVMFVYQSRLLAIVRLYDERIRTSVVEINSQSGEVTELLSLPSGGDTSYAGVVLENDQLFVSYYSSHELDYDGKPHTRIYFARIDLAA